MPMPGAQHVCSLTLFLGEEGLKKCQVLLDLIMSSYREQITRIQGSHKSESSLFEKHSQETHISGWSGGWLGRRGVEEMQVLVELNMDVWYHKLHTCCNFLHGDNIPCLVKNDAFHLWFKELGKLETFRVYNTGSLHLAISSEHTNFS